MIYLDNASTSYVYDECIEVINDILKNHWGNPSNIYRFGIDSKNIVENAKVMIAKCVGCDPEEIYFTSGASEGNAWAIKQRKITYCSPYEHHNYLENENVRILYDYDFKEIRGSAFAHMLVSNESGEIFNVKDFFNQDDVFTICDCTQALGNIEINLKELGCDFAVFSGHKIHAPKGIGFVYIKNGTKIKPLIYGTQQDKYRGGTENVAYIAALAIAVEKAVLEMPMKNILSEEFSKEVFSILDENNIDYIKIDKPHINSTCTFFLKGVETEVLQALLSHEDIFIGTGSGCTDGSFERNLTWQTMNIPEGYNPIRLSFSKENTLDEIKKAMNALVKFYGEITNV